MKKLLVGILLSSTILSNGVIAHASTLEGEVYRTDTKIVDNRKVDNKSTSKEIKLGSEHLIKEKANPTNTSTLDTSWLIGTPRATAKSSSTTMEDYIYAKARIYKSNGVLTAQKAESMNKSRYVSATTETREGHHDAYGNHTYKLQGYKDVYHETYKKFTILR